MEQPHAGVAGVSGAQGQWCVDLFLQLVHLGITGTNGWAPSQAGEAPAASGAAALAVAPLPPPRHPCCLMCLVALRQGRDCNGRMPSTAAIALIAPTVETSCCENAPLSAPASSSRRQATSACILNSLDMCDQIWDKRGLSGAAAGDEVSRVCRKAQPHAQEQMQSDQDARQCRGRPVARST